MRRTLWTIPVATISLCIFSQAATAVEIPHRPNIPADTQIVPVAQGCGPGFWRGPWGGCRNTPYRGALPGGGWAGPPPGGWGYYGNGCPVGYWRGPWGHCRDTPYHGRLPNGSWQ
ncbi:hypothetical protein [Rhizobium sp. BK251]|uniref:GCG_CRPN prefix-to-repeats domain-containing protein n=1 Tax=Rhizobium sp. BK251 TaxID=2512125 RepID=UPI0010D4154C|nr:hypothetical protein [Rhizobium sp. BK251]TCL73504.1 hypothetical protein EV286_10333 [Rhizobium sp. BK251]